MTAVGLDERHMYVDPADPAAVYTSVTTILSSTTGRPWLAAWGAGVAAEFAVDHLEAVAANRAISRAAAVDLIKGEAKRIRDLKAILGTYLHAVLESLLLDTPHPDVPSELIGVEIDGEPLDVHRISEGILNFVVDFDVEPILCECTVAHPMLGYAGTLDLLADVKALGRRLLIDCKTGKILDPTIHGQLAAYRRAPEIWVDVLGNKASMPEVDGAAVLHIRADYERGYKLLDVPADDQAWEYFLGALQSHRNYTGLPRVTGRPLYVPLPDGSQPLPMLEDLEVEGLGRCVNPLRAAGVRTVSDLAALTRPQLRATRGIGATSVDVLVQLVGSYGLTFATPDPTTPLADVPDLGVRAVAALGKLGAETVGDLAQITGGTLADAKGVTTKTLGTIMTLLGDYGLALAVDVEPEAELAGVL